MLFVSAAKDPANPVGKLVSAQQPLGLNYLAFAVDPLGLYRVEPGALDGQQTWNSIRTPRSLALTRRLWTMIHSLT
jgi:hypothetical protein